MLASRKPVYCTIAILEKMLMSTVTSLGVQASLDTRFIGAVFSRDSIRIARDMLKRNPRFVEDAIISVARYQGRVFNDKTEEYPGRCHHEYRTLYVDGVEIGQEQREILQLLSSIWGGTDEEMCYYGTIDATPDFIRLVGECVKYRGDVGILARTFHHRNGEVVTVADAVLAAIGFVIYCLEESSLGLMELKQSNPYSLAYPMMRDGQVAYMHPNGELANTKYAVASVEVQALAYDALMYAAELFPEHEDSAMWREYAEKLGQELLKRTWMPEHRFLAQGIDRDQNGNPRPIKSLSSAAAEVLDTRIFDDLPAEEAQEYLSGIIEMIFSPEFLTSVGFRTRALCHAHLLDYADYHGSLTVWPVIVNQIARGLRRQGFIALAEEVEHRLMAGLNKSGMPVEFWLVMEDGRVGIHLTDAKARAAAVDQVVPVELCSVYRPEGIQTWTISAGIRILHDFETEPSPDLDALPQWKRDLTVKILEQLRLSESICVDIEEGKIREARKVSSRQ